MNQSTGRVIFALRYRLQRNSSRDRTGITILLTLMLSLIVHGSLQADTIETTTGRIVEGIIAQPRTDAPTTQTLTIVVGDVRLTLPSDQVKTIRRASPAENALLIARDDLAAGKIDAAITSLGQALDEDVSPDALAALIVVQGERLAQAAANLNPDQRATVVRLASKLKQADFYQRDDLLARRLQLHAALGQREEASALLGKLAPDYFQTHAEIRQQLEQWLLALLETQVKSASFEDALATLESLKQVNPGLAKARQTQFFLQWGRHERMAGQFEKALDIYTHYLFLDTPAIARDRIAVTLDAAEQLWHPTDQIARAAQLYETYGLPYIPEIATEHLVQLWRDQGARFMWQNDFESARMAFERADQFSPDSAKMDLLRLEFRQRCQSVDQADPQAVLTLGAWAMEHGLPEEALQTLEKVQGSEACGKTARIYITQIRNQLAEKQLLELTSLYEAGRYQQVLQDVHQFLQEPYPQGYLTQAIQLQELTKEAIRLKVSEHPQQAEALLQNAQRRYYQGRYEEAEQILRDIVTHYSDTISYASALNLLALVREKRNLDCLECGDAPPPVSDTATSAPLAASSDTPTTSTAPTAGAEIEKLTRTLGGTPAP